jgi:GNAT superfamily N-acetyltransferase
MNPYSLIPADGMPLAETAALLTRTFTGYFVPIQITADDLSTMVLRDSVDLSISQVLCLDTHPIGIALIARRDRVGRLAAMAVVPEGRGRGAGTWLLEHLLHESRQRGDGEMVLEVIEQNESALRLYQKHGFEIVRRLIEFDYVNPKVVPADGLAEIQISAAGRAVTLHGLPDLPWQLSGETISRHALPARAYRAGPAHAVISNPEAKRVAIYTLLVERPARGQGKGLDLLNPLFFRFPGRAWHVPALCPEELSGFFERAGFQKGSLTQFQMVLQL